MIVKCPCGQIPQTLVIVDQTQGGKYAEVSGDCCGQWSIEFRTLYKDIESDECYKLALEAWNDAPRGGMVS